MVVITRRARTVLTPQPESEDLKELRERTRRTLSRPYKFEPKAVIPPWEAVNTDPFVSLFKPFSKVTAITAAPAVRDLRDELRTFSWRRVLPVIAIGVLLIAIFTIWQALTIINRYPASLNQVAPKLSHTNPTSPAKIPSGSIVPSGTKLDATSPAPVSQAPTGGTTLTSGSNTQPASSGQTNLTSSQPTSAGSAPTTTTTTASAPTCPAGSTCTGTDVTGAPCTISSPCRTVSLPLLGTVLIH